MFVAEAGQFNHIKVTLLHFGRHFFFGMKASLPEVYHLTGSQLGNRKLFSHGPHSSKNNYIPADAWSPSYGS